MGRKLLELQAWLVYWFVEKVTLEFYREEPVYDFFDIRIWDTMTHQVTERSFGYIKLKRFHYVLGSKEEALLLNRASFAGVLYDTRKWRKLNNFKYRYV